MTEASKPGLTASIRYGAGNGPENATVHSDPPVRVLKAESVADGKELSSFDFQSIVVRCRDELDQVRREAASIMDSARDEAVDVRREARDTGFEAGRHEGLAAAQDELARRVEIQAEQLVQERLAEVLPALDQLVDAVEAQTERWRTEWDEHALKVCCTIAERIVRREIQIDPELINKNLNDVLKLIVGTPRLTIRMHPEDLLKLGDVPLEVVQRMSRCTDCELIGDPSMLPGGCIVDTRHGQIDARIETQLDRIRNELLG